MNHTYSRGVRIRIIVASLLGTTIEWYDFFLYGMAASLVFSQLFFPKSDPTTGLLLSYATFSIAFIARPLGGIVFSRLGDRVGRKSVLMITLIGMGVITLAIGLLPGYSVLGIWGAVILCVLRFCQGIFVGGEWGGAVVYISEHAPKGYTGLYGSIPAMGVPLGLLVSTGAMSIMNIYAPGNAFVEWGWRVPFIASVVLIVLGVWMRAGIPETQIFKGMKEREELSSYPLADTLKYHWRSVLKLIGCKFGENLCYYIFTVYVISYAIKTGFTKGNILGAINVAAFFCIFTLLGLGYISDKVGKRNILLFGCGALIVTAIPYFYLVGLSYTWLIICTVIEVSIVWASMYAVHGSVYPGIFPPQVRYTGASLGQQIAGPIAGGLAPFIATFLYSYFQSYLAVSAYLIVAGLISLFSVLSIQRSQFSEAQWEEKANMPSSMNPEVLKISSD